MVCKSLFKENGDMWWRIEVIFRFRRSECPSKLEGELIVDGVRKLQKLLEDRDFKVKLFSFVVV